MDGKSLGNGWGVSERAVALKKAKGLFKEFGFTAGMLKGSIAEGRKKLK